MRVEVCILSRLIDAGGLWDILEQRACEPAAGIEPFRKSAGGEESSGNFPKSRVT